MLTYSIEPPRLPIPVNNWSTSLLSVSVIMPTLVSGQESHLIPSLGRHMSVIDRMIWVGNLFQSKLVIIHLCWQCMLTEKDGNTGQSFPFHPNFEESIFKSIQLTLVIWNLSHLD